MIDGNIEKSLNLRSVQIDKQRTIGTRGGQQIGNQLGAYRHARPVLAILARVTVVRHHHRDPRRRRALECIDHHQKFHQVLVDGIAGRLHDEHIHAAHVLEQLEVDLAVSKTLQLRLAHRNPDMAADLLPVRPVGRAAEQLEAPVLAQIASTLALRSRLGVLRLLPPRVARRLSPPISVGVGRPRCCLSSNCYRHCSRFHLRSTSKLVGFGCILVATANFGWATRIRT